MRKTSSYFVLVLITLLFTACKEQEVLTSGQVMAKELQQVINANGITEVTRKVDNGSYDSSTEDFEILGETIRMVSNYYSLNYVVRYFVDANNDQNLVIVFEL